MKVKKLLPIALLAISALTACGGGNAGGGNGGGGNGGGSSANGLKIWCAAQEKSVVTTILDQYNQANPNKPIPYNIMEVEETDTAENFSKNSTSKNAPDLFLTVDDKLLKLSSNALITKITGDYRTRTVQANTEKAIKNSSVGEDLYGFPICADNGYFLYYNKAQFTGHEDVLGNLNQLMDYVSGKGKKLYYKLQDGFYSSSLFASPAVCGLDSMHYELNGSNLSYHATWDSAEGVAMATAMADLLTPAYNEGKGYLIGSTEDKDIQTRMGGDNPEIIAAISGVWKENAFKDAMGADNLGAVKLPTFTYNGKTAQMASFSGSKVWCINNTTTSSKKRMAVAAAELLISKEAQLLRFQNRSINPSNKEALEDPRYINNKGVSTDAFLAQDQFAIAQGASVEGRYWSVGEDIGSKLITGDLGTTESGEAYTWASYLKAQMNLLKKAEAYK